jgi:23S rRNA (adenine2503-C2)-methyltransferase
MIKKLGTFKDFSDSSLKSVFDIGDNKIIEMTMLNNKKDMDVICAPTHHFCNLGCKMCHLTNEKLTKKMTPIKFEDFYKCLLETIKISKNNKKRKLLISFMGVGDPLLNLKLIQDLFLVSNNIKEKFNYDSIGFAISTMMPNDNILELKKIVTKYNIPLKVHFSLHTPINKLRSELIPNSKIYVEEALAYLNDYRNCVLENEKIMQEFVKLHRTSDVVEIHYTLIKNVNDSEEELSKVCELLKKYNITIKFIKFNPTNELKESDLEKHWIDKINKEVPDVRVKFYAPPGREIGSSCGEFTKHYYHQEIETKEEKIEFLKWKRQHQVS